MENIVLGDGFMERRQANAASDSIVEASIFSSEAGGSQTLPAISQSDGSFVTAAAHSFSTTTVPPTGTPVVPSTTTQTINVAASSTAPAAAATTPGKSTINSTTLIAILVPVCVVLAAVPTAAYLIYMKKRDKRQRAEEADIMRGRGANSSSGATGEALLARRSMSAASHHERKFTSVSTDELEMGATGAMLEKSIASSSPRQDGSIFAPASHGPAGRRSGSVRSQQRPGFKPPPPVSQSPTLPPLDFTTDDACGFSLDPTQKPTTSPSKPTVPASLPTFAPTQSKQRSPNPALIPGRNAAPSPTPVAHAPAPVDNPSWPLPADGLRDSVSVYSSSNNDRVMSHQLQSKPLPAVAPRAQHLQQQQQGPRESSIAYGVPPIPPSPIHEVAIGDRRSGASRKRDSDAVSELSYTPSMRSRRDTRRDTDAISVISAMSQNDR